MPIYSKSPKVKTEKELASLFYPQESFGYGRSYAFQSSLPQGSVFKLVTGYEALRQGMNTFSIIDEQKGDANVSQNMIVAYSANHTPYPRLYKGGRLPRTARRHVGKIDLVGALEYSSNPYFSIVAGDYFKDPEDLNNTAELFGYGKKTGIDLPSEASGFLPNDLKTNRTGLYTYAIGQHTLLCTPLQSSLMLSTIANGGSCLKPQIIKKVLTSDFEEKTKTVPELKAITDLTEKYRRPILEGMDRCVWSERGCARVDAISYLLENQEIKEKYLGLKHQMLGKTGTAEFLFNPGKYPSSLPQIYKHIWFGSIAFNEKNEQPNVSYWESPELVVVVCLRFGSGGKEAAPLAGQILLKWREIQKKHSQ